jgi:hypothetical protein
MTGLDRDEAAARAGIEPSYLNRLIELGIVTSDANGCLTLGAVRRAQLAHTLATAGLPLEALASVLKSGQVSMDFMDSPVYERFAALGSETFRQVSERTGVPVHLLTLVREAGEGRPRIPTTAFARTS